MKVEEICDHMCRMQLTNFLGGPQNTPPSAEWCTDCGALFVGGIWQQPTGRNTRDFQIAREK